MSSIALSPVRISRRDGPSVMTDRHDGQGRRHGFESGGTIFLTHPHFLASGGGGQNIA